MSREHPTEALAVGSADEGGWRERLDATLEAAVDAILIINEAGIVATANPAVERLFGWPRSELIGRNVNLLMPEPDASRHDGYLANYLKTGVAKIIGKGREVTGRRADGTTFQVELSVGEGRHGEERFFVGLLRDITDRRALEDQLRQRQEELRQTQDNAPVTTAITDLDGRVLEVNNACQAMFGYGAEEFATLTLAKISHPDDLAELGELQERLRRQELDTGELDQRFVAKDGRTLYGTLHVGAVHGRDGQPQRFVVQIVDRTHQVEAERQIRDQQERLAHVNRLSTLGEMAAAIAHEVNQPLGAISNYAQACRVMLQKDRKDPEVLDDILEKVSSQAQRAGDVIRRLRSLAKGQETGRDLVDINDAVRGVGKLAELDARMRGVDIQFSLQEPLPRILADNIQIQQVVLNLMRNGVEAMREAEGREAILEVTTQRLGKLELEVAVGDRGPGIDPSIAEEIMSPFVSTKSSGMGMGLAICQSIVASHGGRLWFEARDGGGTTFHLTLPLEPSESATWDHEPKLSAPPDQAR